MKRQILGLIKCFDILTFFLHLPSLKPTVRPWKWMVGIRSFPIGEAYFQGQTVSFREGRSSWKVVQCVQFPPLQIFLLALDIPNPPVIPNVKIGVKGTPKCLSPQEMFGGANTSSKGVWMYRVVCIEWSWPGLFLSFFFWMLRTIQCCSKGAVTFSDPTLWSGVARAISIAFLY